jgi:hypothetical protein
MAGNEQGTMDGETHIKRAVDPAHRALRSHPQPAGVGTDERTGAHRAARIATLAEVLARGSDPRLDRTGTTPTPA